MSEDALLTGVLEPTNEPYAIAANAPQYSPRREAIRRAEFIRAGQHPLE